jgi:broad specificity phosphatase PhoE
MLRIVLIRPGSTDYDRQGRIQGTLDIPLNEEGNHEVTQVIVELRGVGIEVLYAPSCQPAQQTAETIAEQLDVKLKRLDRMQNLDHGLWQGLPIDEVRRKQPKVYRQWQEQPGIVCPPEGEMLSHAEERVRATMAKLLKRHKQGIIGIVVPEPLASLVRCFVKHEEIGDLWKAAQEHRRWEILDVEPEKAVTSST